MGGAQAELLRTVQQACPATGAGRSPQAITAPFGHLMSSRCKDSKPSPLLGCVGKPRGARWQSPGVRKLPFTGAAALTWEEKKTVKILNQDGVHRTRDETGQIPEGLRRQSQEQMQLWERRGQLASGFQGHCCGDLEIWAGLLADWESRKSRDCLLVEIRNPGWVWCTSL